MHTSLLCILRRQVLDCGYLLWQPCPLALYVWRLRCIRHGCRCRLCCLPSHISKDALLPLSRFLQPLFRSPLVRNRSLLGISRHLRLRQRSLHPRWPAWRRCRVYEMLGKDMHQMRTRGFFQHYGSCVRLSQTEQSSQCSLQRLGTRPYKVMSCMRGAYST